MTLKPSRLNVAACVCARQRETDAVGEALAEGPGRNLHARRDAHLGMAGGLRVNLPELFEVVEREVVPRQVQHRVLQRARVAVRQHEAVAVGPMRSAGS